jgi:hypothetical protein
MMDHRGEMNCHRASNIVKLGDPLPPKPHVDEPEIPKENSDEETVCAICFENRQFVSLPCQCTISYCGPCWDRALAASVTVRGRAQCPSCRMALRVDYSPELEGLVFSKETERATLAQWRQRLYKKARPVQIRLLQDYGAQRNNACRGAFSKLSAPICVCGDVLEKIDGSSRVVRMLEDTEPGWRNRVSHDEWLVQKLAMSSLITCDLCDEVAMRTGFVWTCKNGPHTVLHPAAYDVCESCFNQFSGCKDKKKELQGEPLGMVQGKDFTERSKRVCSPSSPPSSLEETPASEAQACPHNTQTGCCNFCTGALFRAIRCQRTQTTTLPRIRNTSASGRVRSAMNSMVRGLRSGQPHPGSSAHA